MSDQQFDLLIVGAGINGAGIARDATLRGLKVLLLDKGDIGAGTSSWSTKMIHGGLRYLEHYEFGLVRKALKERDTLARIATHLVNPLRLNIPDEPHTRPAKLVKLGLFLYDNLYRSQFLPGSVQFDLKTSAVGTALKKDSGTAFAYSDLRVDDHRLVIANAKDAKSHGAEVIPSARVVKVEAIKKQWHITYMHKAIKHTVTAPKFVNATGPWASQFMEDAAPDLPNKPLKLIKGSHIVVPKLFLHDQAYLFQQEDGRVVFAIPFQRDFTLVGTTEELMEGDPGGAKISDAERTYLLNIANERFSKQTTETDIVWDYSGVRPIIDMGHGLTKASRDYSLQTFKSKGDIGLNVLGGKLTTYRTLAKDAMKKLKIKGRCLTGDLPLYGNDENFDAKAFQKKHPAIPMAVTQRLAESYGTAAEYILAGCTDIASLGEHFGATLYAREVEYLMSEEWAASVNSIIWHRTKQGLFMNEEQKKKLSEYMLHKFHDSKKEIVIT